MPTLKMTSFWDGGSTPFAFLQINRSIDWPQRDRHRIKILAPNPCRPRRQKATGRRRRHVPLTRQRSLPGTNIWKGHRHRFGRSFLSEPLCSMATEATATSSSQRRVRVTRPFGRFSIDSAAYVALVGSTNLPCFFCLFFFYFNLFYCPSLKGCFFVLV